MDDTKISEEEKKKDIESILKGEYTEEAITTLGENRGQLFIRIPQNIRKQMKLKKGEKILFKTHSENRKRKISIEIIK